MYVDLTPPYRLPPQLTCKIVGVVYNPHGKSAQQEHLASHIVDTIDQVKNNGPNCGMAILSDFNKLDIEDLLLHHDLKQVVESVTRVVSVLDLMITSFSNQYCKPESNAPIGSADHNFISWNPVKDISRVRATCNQSSNKRVLRRFIRSSIDAFGRWVCQHNWYSDREVNANLNSMTESFMNDIDFSSQQNLSKFFIPINRE